MALNQLGLGFTFDAKDNASPVMHKVQGALKETGKEAKTAQESFFKLDVALRMQERFKGLSEAIGGPVVDVLKEAAKANMELEKAIALVGGESDEAIFPQEKMRAITESLAKEFGRLPVDQAKAMYEAVGMGANDAAKSTNLMRAANTLAVAGNADLKISIDALGGAMRAYGADWTKAMDFADTIRMAEATGKTSVEELAESLGRITSMSASLGLTFEETTGAIASMTATGIKANMAVTGLHEAFANILHPSHDAQMEAARLGIRFNEASLKAKGLHGFLEDIAHSAQFRGVTSMKNLFTSVEGFNAIMQLTSGNMKGFDDALEAMSHKQGDAQRGMDIMANTLSFQEEKFKAAKVATLGLIGKAFEPLQMWLLKTANTIMQNLSPGVVKVAVYIGLAIAAVFALASALIGVAVAAYGAFIAFDTLGAGLIVALAPILPIVAGFVALGVAFAAFKVAYEKNVGGFADKIDAAFKKVKLAINGLGQLFSDGGFSGDVMTEMDKAGNEGVKGFAINVFLWFNRIKNFVVEIFDGFERAIDKMATPFNKFMHSLSKLGEALGFVTEENDPQANADQWVAWGKAGAKVGEWIANAFETVVTYLTYGIHAVTSFIHGLKKLKPAASSIVKSFGSILDSLKLISDAMGLTKKDTQDQTDGWEKFGSAVASVVGFLAMFIAIMSSSFATFFRPWAKGFAILKGILDDFSEYFTGWGDVIIGFFTHDFAQMWRGVKEITRGALHGVLSMLFTMAEGAAAIVDKILRATGKKSDIQGTITGMRGQFDKKFESTLGEPGEKPEDPEHRRRVAMQGLKKRKDEIDFTREAYESSPWAHGDIRGAVDPMQEGEGGKDSTSDLLGDIKAELQKPNKEPPRVYVMLDGKAIAAQIKMIDKEGAQRDYSPMPAPE